MKKSFLTFLFVILFCGLIHQSIGARSIHRKSDPTVPRLTACWKGSKRKYVRIDSHYEEYPIFASAIYLDDMIKNHLLLSNKIIKSKTDSAPICSATLNTLLEELVHEVFRKKRSFKHFSILQDKNFNRRKKCGLLVLKFNDYPLVVKLFIETPKTFINPYGKGFEPIFIHYMSGGTNRHVGGLPRIMNRKHILAWAEKNARWKNHIAIPRKWFWIPKNPMWIELKGNNIGNKHEVTTFLPGTYALVADYINTQEPETDFIDERSQIIMDLCNALDMFVDPHTNNFIIKKHPITGKPFVTIIDTEHFPTMIGLKEKTFFADHVSWITYMASKCLEDIYFRPKSLRLKAQKNLHKLSLKK